MNTADMNKLIMDTLKPVGVPVSFMNYNNQADTYIVFLRYNDGPVMSADDDVRIEKFFYQVDVFSGGSAYMQIVDDVKKRMKAAGFTWMFGSETYDEDMRKYRKIFRFNYHTKYKEEI